MGNYAPIPKDYECNYWVDDGTGIKRSYSQFSTRFWWEYWKHRDEINKKREEVMAIMYLQGKIELSEMAIPHLDKNYCKPIIYKQTIKRFSYEKHKSNSDALRNYGWSDLLLSGLTPTRSKPQKHAKHH
jgi:hypothetical protein